MTPTKFYRKQSIIDSFWVVTLINAQILCKTSKLGNKGVVPTMGGRSGGGGGWRSLLGLGRGRTYRNRYFLSDLIRCCQATNDEKPALKSFPCTSYLFPIATS